MFYYLTAILMASLTCCFAQADLQFAEKPQLVDCAPAATSPCFRLRLNVIDKHGQPASLALPQAEHLNQAITVKCNDMELTPFYASGGETRGQQRKRFALLLLDVSGSMIARLPDGRTRFEAARDAAAAFVRAMQSGTDRVAIVPFGSHNVTELIQSADFVRSPQRALQDISELPVPESRSNTAIFSALSAGVDLLKETVSQNSGAEAMLLIMTDGRNDVRAGDDPGLLEGQSGLNAAAKKVRGARFPVVAIGFGDPSSLDEAALKQISTKYHIVQDAAALQQVFTTARILLQDRLHVSFASPWKDRSSLAGGGVSIQVLLRLADGSTVRTPQSKWSSPQISAPVYEDRCDENEMKAALAFPGLSGPPPLYVIVRPALVFLGLSGLLVVLWFWVPRLIWPDEYIGRDLKSIHVQNRWRSAGVRPAKDRVPVGFTTSHGAAAGPRTPFDATQLEPRNDMVTRTRLELNLPERGQ